MDKPNLLLIGTGRWGSVIEKKLSSFTEIGGFVKAGRNWRDYIDRKDIDGVIVATPPSTHTEIALACIERNIPVYIEKPFTLSVREAQAIIEAATNTGTAVQVGHIHLYNGAFIKLMELSRHYGPITHISTEAASFGPYRSDYSVLWDFASHDVSMILALLSEEPVQVSASAHSFTQPSTRNWDISETTFLFPSGITAQITSSRLSPTKVRKVTVMCERATIIYDDTLAEKKIAVYEGLTPKTLDQLGAGKTTLEAIYPEYEMTDPLVKELQEFVAVVLGTKLPTSDALFGVRVVKVLEQAETSIVLDV